MGTKTKIQPNNKEILQSYILTSAKYDYSVYEKRFLYRLVELAQSQIKGLDFHQDCKKIEHDLFGFVHITLPISSMLNNEDDKNHSRIKTALQSLQRKLITYEDNEVWESISLIAFPNIKKYKSSVSCTIHPKIWDCILDFTNGYKKYELVTAMQFESIYTMRFYEFFADQKNPINFSLDKLKDIFCLQGKYKAFKDFRIRVIDVAKKELDEKSPVSFEYEYNTPKHKVGKKIISVTFYPYKTNNQDPSLEQKKLNKEMSLSWDFDKNTIAYLKEAFGFTTKELKIQRELLLDAQNKITDFIGFLATKKAPANRVENPKGYLINAIKGELANEEDKSKNSPETTKVARNLSDKFNINN